MNKKNFNRGLAFFIYSSWIVLAMNVNIFYLIEGYFNPVVRNITVTYHDEKFFYGNIDKVRSCKLKEMEVYIKNNKKYKMKENDFPDNLTHLNEGEHNFGPMPITISKDELDYTTLRLEHICEDDYLFAKSAITVVKLTKNEKILAKNNY